MKEYLRNKLQTALNTFASNIDKTIILEKPRQPEHGDLTTNIAMMTARRLGKNPRQFAQELVDKLNLDSTYVDKVEIAGPGFINFRFTNKYFFEQLSGILKNSLNYGKVNIGEGKKNSSRIRQRKPDRSVNSWTRQRCRSRRYYRKLVRMDEPQRNPRILF